MKKRFYKYLDNPKMLMGMALTDLLSLAIPLYMGICLKKFILFALIGGSLFMMRRKVARALPKYYLIGLIYWHLPTTVFNRMFKVALPPSHKRFYLR
ncbi:type IV conjugative transfer system protein TraL [Candidatus Neptunochlamydia vexilliferae]|nr:type IV conjugative transfer system protein TraL [Candidatus Neptunochlamydia vexilliferae]